MLRGAAGALEGAIGGRASPLSDDDEEEDELLDAAEVDRCLSELSSSLVGGGPSMASVCLFVFFDLDRPTVGGGCRR